MGLNFPSIQVAPIIGTKVGTTRTPWTLTAAYQTEGLLRPTKSFAVGGYSILNLDILYTMGATETLNSIELKIEGTPDGTNFYRLPNESVSGGTSTLTAREFTFVGTDAAAATISLGLDIFYKAVRISAKETGVVTNFGTIYIESTLSGK